MRLQAKEWWQLPGAGQGQTGFLPPVSEGRGLANSLILTPSNLQESRFLLFQVTIQFVVIRSIVMAVPGNQQTFYLRAWVLKADPDHCGRGRQTERVWPFCSMANHLLLVRI